MAVQNSLPGTVDILSQKTGDVITHYSQDTDRVVNLTQTSIVRINASPESVNSYERQGNDLIVHMKDGSTVRYQNFFQLDAQGLHSELIFQDEQGVHHALFPFASEAGPATAEAIVPTFSDASLAAMTGAGAAGEGISTAAILGGLAVVGGIAGIGLAASSNGGGGGGGGNNNGGGDGNPDDGGGDGNGDGDGDGNGDDTDTDGDGIPDGSDNDDDGDGVPDPDDTDDDGNGDGGENPPGGQEPSVPSTLVVNPISDDNVINAQERGQDVVVSGSTDPVNAGRTVVITLGGNSWTGVIGDDGTWNITLPAAALQALTEGSNALTVTLVDVNGNTVTQTIDLTLDTTPPTLELTEFTPNGVLDGNQADNDKLVRGYTSPEDAGQTVTVTLNNQTYTAVVNEDGSWQTTIPAADLQALGDGQSYTVDISVTDAAGNVTTGQIPFTVNLTEPVVTVDPVTGDDTLNSAEIQLPQVVTGHTENIPADSLITLSLGARLYYARVLGDGSWSAVIPAADLQALQDGTITLTATALLPDNSTVVSLPVELTIDRTQTGIAIAILSADDALNAAEAAQPLEVRGITTVAGPGVVVQVGLNGKVYNAVVDNAGNWSAVIPPEDLALLQDGPRDITATVVLNDQSAQDTRTLNVAINHLPQPTVDTPFGDGLLSASEILQDQTVTGNTGVTGTGQSVAVQIGGQIYTAPVDNEGNWTVTVPASQLQTLPQGDVPIVVIVTDGAGNVGNTDLTATLDTTPPLLSVLPLTNDGRLNAQELTTTQTLSGTSSEPGQLVDVTLNGQTYSGVVGEDGRWQIDLPAEALNGLTTGDYPLVASVTDAAGNVTQTTQTISVKNTLPVITVAPFTGDDALNGAEVKTSQFLTGTTDAEPGSTVSVSVGGWSQSATVDSDGSFRVEVPVTVLQSLDNGPNTLQVSVTDLFNQATTVQHPITVDVASNGVALDIISTDNYLNAEEAASPLIISGTSAGLPLNTPITVTFNNVEYPAFTDANGNWQVTIGPEVFAGLPDGAYTVTATALNGDLTDSETLTVIVTNLPAPAFDTPFVDGALSLGESTQDQILTGTTGSTGPGQTVSVTLNNQTYQGTVDSTGVWSVTVPSGALDTLPDGSTQTLTVNVADAAGNTQTNTADFTVDLTAPQITVDPFATDDFLNIAEAGAAQTLSGIAAGAEEGTPITVTLNGTVLNTTAGPNGAWSVEVPQATLAALPNGPASFIVTSTDQAGNSSSTTHVITVAANPALAPQLVIDPVTQNNIIDAAERDAGFTITGSTLNVQQGQTVSVVVNGLLLPTPLGDAIVDADGNWSLAVPPGTLALLLDGGYTLTATVTDAAGNPASQTRDFTVNSALSAIAVDPLTGDDTVGVADIANGLVITGDTVNVNAGTALTVTLNGRQYAATVQADGTWSVTVPQPDALLISNGLVTFSASTVDAAGNNVSTTHDFTLITQTPSVVTLNTPFTDGVLSDAEALAGGTLSGTTGQTGAGQSVTVVIGETPYEATVDARGNWTLALTPEQLQGLTDGTLPLTVNATDIAGNVSTLESSLTIDRTPPALTLNPVTADNIVNSLEVTTPLTISGTATFDPNNPQTVVVLVNGQSYSALVLSDNTWSVTLLAGALSNAVDGPVSIVASVSDAAGNTNTVRDSFTLDASPLSAPTLTVDPITGDDYINAAEIGGLITVTGATTGVEAGQPVTVSVNGQTFTGEVGDGGVWSVDITAGALAGLTDGAQQIIVSVTDAAGNPASVTRPVTVIAQPGSLPVLTVDIIAADDVVNATEHNAALTITGTAQNLTAGTLVTVTIAADAGGTPVVVSGIVGDNGLWSAVVPQTSVVGLVDGAYTVTATATDAAQNPATATHGLTVDLTGPALTVDVAASVFADNILNVSESATDQLLTGTTAPGATVVLQVNGQPITAPVIANDVTGAWTLLIPAAQLQALSGDGVVLTVVSTDPQGNTTPFPITVNVGNDALPTLTFDPISLDNVINGLEAAGPLTLTGTSTGLAVGTAVTVTINGQAYAGSVTAENVWTVVTGQDANPPLAALGSGQFVATVAAVDAYANPANGSTSLEVVIATPVAALPATLFADDFLNAAEAGAGQTLTGSTGLVGPDQTVSLAIDGGTPVTGTVDGNGNWTVTLPPEVLTTLADGAHSLVVTTADRAGNTTVSEPVDNFTSYVTPLPTPVLAEPLFGDDVLVATEAATGYTVTIDTGVTDPARITGVTVALNNGTPLAATSNGDGIWSVTLTPEQLQALPDGTLPLTVTVTDAAGNSVALPETFTSAINDVPEVTVNPFFGGDNVLNSAESQVDQTLTGNTGVTGPGQTVTVAIAGTQISVTAVTDDNGNWTAVLPAAALAGLPSGTPQDIVVTASDQYGNVDTTDPIPFTVQTALPVPTIDQQPLFGDGVLNLSEAAGPITLTGTTGITGGNQYVSVTIDVNGVRYVANVNAAGVWTLALPAGALQGLTTSPDHTLTVTAEDQYGNSASSTPATFGVAFVAPTVTLDEPFGDGYLNVAESAGATLTGTYTVDPTYAGATAITVNINGRPFTAALDTANGTWSVALDAGTLSDLAQGEQTVTVSITDGQNPNGLSDTFTVATQPPTIAITADTFSADGTLNWAESQQPQTISGTTTNVQAGQPVTVTLGGQAFTTLVQADGSWTLQLTPQQLATLTPGDSTLTASVVDRAQNPASTTPAAVTIDLTQPAVSFSLDAVTGDNILNAAELGTGTVTISGHTSGVIGAVNVTLNGTLIGTTEINPDGTWTLAVPSTLFSNQGPYTLAAASVTDSAQTATSTVTVDTVAPTLTINALAGGDDVLVTSEANAPLTISGQSDPAEAGRQVVVTITGNGETATYYAQVDGTGAWTTTVPQGDVADLTSGQYTVSAALTDAAGNPAEATRPLTVDVNAPLLTVDALGVPAVLNTVNAAGGLLLSGTGEPGETVDIILGPLTTTATVDESGRWQYTFPQLDLNSLTDGAQVIQISSTDAYGNTSTNRVALNVALNQGLGVLVDDLFGTDGVLNVAESLVTQVLTGTVSGDYRGASVQATLIGTNINIPLDPVAVNSSGGFSINLPPSLWQGIVDNTLALNLDVTDAFGNTTNQLIDLNLALTDLPVVGDVLVGLDNLVNVNDIASGVDQVVTGTLSNVADVASVVVNVAGQAVNAVVDAATGTWSAALPNGLLGALPAGTTALQVQVTDTAGNVINSGASFTLANVAPTITLAPLFSDGILNVPELLSGVISGTATGLNGQTLTVQVGDTEAINVVVGPDGAWSVNLPAAVQSALQALGTGTVAVNVTAADAWGNNAAAGANVTLSLLEPVLNSVTLFTDNLLSAADALVSQTITGTVAQAQVGSLVSVTVGNQTFNGTVGNDGLFSIQVAPSQLASLTDGSLSSLITITTPDGNTTTTNGPLVNVGIGTLPTVAITSVLGGADGFLNAAEAAAGQVISGTTSLASGTVQVLVNGIPLLAPVVDGVWSVTAPASLLQSLANGAVTVTAQAVDAVGNVANSGTQIVNAIVQNLPQIILNPLFGDGTLSLSDLLNPQVLSGTATNLAAGTQINVALGPINLTTTVGANGAWSVPVATNLLQGLTDGLLNVSVTAVDPAGNPATASSPLTVSIAALPSIVINSIFGDGGLNVADLLNAQVITGSSTNAVGSLVNVTLGGKNYTTTVGSDGSWQVSVPKTDLSSLLDGTLTVNASVVNPAGNSTSTSGLLNVITHALPSISLTSLFGNDSYLNVSEATSGQVLSGQISGPADGASVVVSLGGNNYNATVNSDGTWSLPVASSILQGLTNGALKVGVTVTDKVGNTNTTSSDVTVKLTTPTLSLNPLASLDLVTLLSRGLTLSGGSTNLARGSVVHLSLLNGTVSTTAVTDANGNWTTNIGLGLNLLQLLSLSSVVNLYASDAAGNTGYLNVGLGGNIISTTPPAGTTLLAAHEDTAVYSLLSTSDETSSHVSTDSQQSSTSDTLLTASAVRDDAQSSVTETTASTATATDTPDGAYVIGGVSIDLADGTTLSGETVTGSAGNDTIHLAALGFTQIDGGAGTDTLVLDGVNLLLNLTELAGKVHNVEIVDLGKSGTNSLTLDVNQAITLTDKPEDDLIVKGVDGDQVNLVKSGATDVWEITGQRDVDGVQFDVYHNSAQTTTLGDVLVQQGLHVNQV